MALNPRIRQLLLETSRGHHQNYLIARDLANDSLMKTVVSSHLASRGVWAMAGMVGSGGYTLSQKASGIGEPLQQGLGRRTDHGRKPLAVIPTTNDDTVTPDSGWARLEVRYADACISATGQFLDLVSTSLALRLVEQRHKVDIKELEAMAFRDIVHAVKVFSNDLSLGGVTVRANDQRRVSAVDYQEALIAEARKLSEKVELPADEVLAIELWQTVCDELRRADLNKGEYGQLPRMLDFAARHLALRRRYEPEEINSHNYEAVAYHLRWDRILPEGYGLRYWARQPSEYVPVKDVESLLEVPPLTRATARRKAFGMGLLDGMGWSYYAVLAGKTRRTMPLPDPYSSDLLQAA